jgi:hypothetical protein
MVATSHDKEADSVSQPPTELLSEDKVPGDHSTVSRLE